MKATGILLLAITIGLPIAWLVSEFRSSRVLRIFLGILSMVVVTVIVSSVYTGLTKFEYNASFGSATKELIETSVLQAEDGQLERVMKVWRGLNANYQPTYENRARYPELIAEATARIRGDVPTAPGSEWDVSTFSEVTWKGHWQNDTGFWLVIESSRPVRIWRSGDPPTPMHSVTLSADGKTLKFQEGDQWAHTLNLKNKYETSHEWFDLKQRTVWQTDTMHKLIRATEDQKRPTQQGTPYWRRAG